MQEREQTSSDSLSSGREPRPTRSIGLRAVGNALSAALVGLLALVARVSRALFRQLCRIPPIGAAATKLAALAEGPRRHLNVWRTSWAEAANETPAKQRSREELAFLPAVLEVEESPPSPHGRALIYIIVSLFTVAIVWAIFGKIDIIAIAKGKIIPSDRSKIIQPLESGVIKAIRVKDGQWVKRGEALIELDPTASAAEEQRWTNEQQAAVLEALRLKAVLAGKATFKSPAGFDPNLVRLQQQQLVDQLAEHKARTESARLIIAQRSASIEALKANIDGLEKTVPMLEQKAQAYRRLVDKQHAPHLTYLDAEEQRISKSQELVKERHRLAQESAAFAEAQRNFEAIVFEFKKARRNELSIAETKMKSLSKEVIKAETRATQQTLIAPIDGVVQQLAVHTIGGVVTPAQQLLVIAPREGQLEVEAYVENKDIGFVNEEQPAEVKVEAFPFTRYGTVKGSVISLSRDAVPIEKTGFFFSAHVSMSQTDMPIGNGKRVQLSPGMNVTVEIKTGTRRVIEYFLSPLLHAAQESARER